MKPWTREEKIAHITAVAERGVSSENKREVGIELEHFLIDRDTKKRRFYGEPGGVQEVLEQIGALPGFASVRSHGHILGAQARDYAISIEPGAQFEISVRHDPSVRVLQKRYQDALTRICPVLEKYNLTLLTIGLDPENTVDAIPVIPKERYRIMTEYLSAQGAYATTMMRRSCALQVSLDYSNEADFVRKFRVLSALSPILYTLFDSAALLEKKPVPSYNMRQEVWRQTDPARCGIVPGTFDATFGFRRYAEWVLGIAPLFIPQADGSVRETGAQSLDRLLDTLPTEEERRVLIAHALSIVFPDVRLKEFLEVRMMDEVPGNLAFGAAVLLKGLLYDEENLHFLETEFADASESMVARGKNSGRDNGIQGYYFSDYFAHWGVRLADRAKRAVSGAEGEFLDDLRRMWDQLDTPRSIFEREMRMHGYESALSMFEVEPGCRMKLRLQQETGA